MLEHYPFAKVIDPISKEEFFAEYWQKKILVIRREQVDYYKDLLNYQSVEQAITTLDSQHPDVSMADHCKPDLQSSDYTYDTGLIDVARLFNLFSQGSSIALNHLHDRVAPLGNLCRSLEQELSTRFQTNIYFTPPGAQGFPPHFDSHCVFVLQCEGTKHWQIYGTPLELPHHGQRFDPKKVDVGEVTMEFDLNPGDAIYIPRGLAHAANTEGLEEASLHITLGALQHNWSDMLLEALAKVSIDDSKLRQALPIGFAHPGFNRDKARDTFKQMVQHAVEKMDFDQAFDVYVDDIIASRHPLLPEQFQQIQQLWGLKSVDNRAGARTNVLHRLEKAEDKMILHCYGGSVTFPSHVEEPLRYALSHNDYKIADLPGDLDDPGKLVLVKRLVREGVLILK